MKRITAAFLNNQMLSGSFVSLLGSNFANVIAYMYHFILGRMLGKADYGELAVFLSIISLFSSSYSFIGTLVVKFVSKEATQEKGLEVFERILKLLTKPALFLSLIFFAIVLFTDQLNIHLLTAALIPPIMFVSFILFLYKSYFQGTLSFAKLNFYTIFELLLRLIFGLLFVFLGMKAGGAALGFFISVALLVFFAYTKTAPKKTHERPLQLGRFFSSETLPILVSSVCTTAFFTVDVLLVRSYFSAADSGSYAAAATLGKTVLFSTLPITAVLFPLISRKHSEGSSGTLILLTSLVLTTLVGGAFSLIFYFFPDLAVNILYGSSFSDTVPLMFPYGIFMLLLVLSLVFTNYYLPREKYVPIGLLLLGSVAQVIGVVLFHGTLLTVLWVSIIVTLALFSSLLVYFCYENWAIRHYLSKAFGSSPRV